MQLIQESLETLCLIIAGAIANKFRRACALYELSNGDDRGLPWKEFLDQNFVHLRISIGTSILETIIR